MKGMLAAIAALAGMALTAGAWAAAETAAQSPVAPAGGLPTAQRSVTQGSVTVEGKKIDYTATAGTIILRDQDGHPTGSMFYVAYVKRGVKDESQRPVTFFHNGGPGSSTIWLHMGAFGPRRITTTDLGPTPAAPYQLVNNDYSLLDVTDEVFIDAMNTGYSRIIGKDQGGVGTTRDFYGTDPDMKSFAQFIKRYSTGNHRWNSPKYLYGESYGTLRNEVLVNYLEQAENMDVNGIVLQSAYMGSAIPYGSDIQYEVVLPSMAATAWYHHKVPNAPADMQAFLAEVEHFAMNQYAVALNAGNTLSAADFDAIAEKLHGYIGLPVAYIKKARLRVGIGQFRQALLGDQNQVVGELDARFSGPTMDAMTETAQTDPQYSSIDSAYVTGLNTYMHQTLKYGDDQVYRPTYYNVGSVSDGGIAPWPTEDENLVTGEKMRDTNGAIDLAQAMKYDARLQVLVHCGYFDFSTPFYGMVYAVNHMDIPPDLQSHIHFDYYDSGHMVYVHVPDLKKLHDNTAAFIRATDSRHG